ncbi:MAG: hypothetical protein WA476_07460, partial [Acidobacteriaceae bacterium]
GWKEGGGRDKADTGNRLHLHGLREGLFAQRQVAENEPFCLDPLASCTRGNGDGFVTNTAVSRAVGEAMILTAHGEAAATVALPIEECALGPGAAAGMVATAKCLAGEGAGGAGLTVIEGGTEARHGSSGNGKGRVLGGLFGLGSVGGI